MALSEGSVGGAGGLDGESFAVGFEGRLAGPVGGVNVVFPADGVGRPAEEDAVSGVFGVF